MRAGAHGRGHVVFERALACLEMEPDLGAGVALLLSLSRSVPQKNGGSWLSLPHNDPVVLGGIPARDETTHKNGEDNNDLTSLAN